MTAKDGQFFYDVDDRFQKMQRIEKYEPELEWQGKANYNFRNKMKSIQRHEVIEALYMFTCSQYLRQWCHCFENTWKC